MRDHGYGGHQIEKELGISYRRVREALMEEDGKVRKLEIGVKKEK
jgi:hypothetical protein